MASLREIRRRIKSIGSTAQITRAMEMVAAAKMRKAQQATLSTRPFGQLLYRMQRAATTHAADFEHPFMAPRPVRRRAVVIVGTDKGLCGALNTNLFRVAAQYDPAATSYIAVGKRAAQFIARTRRQLAAEFTITESPRFSEARPIAAFVRDLFLKGDADQVQIVLTRFINTIKQEPVVIDFLPIGEIKGMPLEAAGANSRDTVEILFEPSPEAVLSYLFGHYLNIVIYRALLEAKASEHSARRVAMTNATDSATDLIKQLTLEYNQIRQGNITRELLEIAGGQAADN